MLALQMDVSSTYDRFCADKFVYALDHAPRFQKAKQPTFCAIGMDALSADSAGRRSRPKLGRNCRA
jgi:hypothetical protein